jgi:16S rRNA (guanine1516-N2)-methyltransferase
VFRFYDSHKINFLNLNLMTMKTKNFQSLVQVACVEDSAMDAARSFALRWNLAWRTPDCEFDPLPYCIVFGENVRLESSKGKSNFSLSVDFVQGENRHRRFQGGGAGQAVAKALGLKKGKRPSILDLTAGMGSDAFVLACLGSSVTLCERNPIVHALLNDGIERAMAYVEDRELTEIASRMHLLEEDALTWQSPSRFDCVYLDPMFPERKKKSALVKKDMQAFHDIVGGDEDAEGLLERALSWAIQRVVVKRPKLASYLAGQKPSHSLQGKATRFDVYQLTQ